MAALLPALMPVLAQEGNAAVTRDPNDPGGVTKWGISSNSYPTLDIPSLTFSQAANIYRDDFWAQINGDRLASQPIAQALLDTVVLFGVDQGSKIAQTAANAVPQVTSTTLPPLKIDGHIGPISLDRLNSLPEGPFLAALGLLRIVNHIRRLRADKSAKRFILGWIIRTLQVIGSIDVSPTPLPIPVPPPIPPPQAAPAKIPQAK